MPRRYVHRHQVALGVRPWMKAGLGAGAAFAVATLFGDVSGASLIMAPMGASAVLIFGVPNSPMSQPAHVIGGHLLAAVVALVADRILPGSPWTLAGVIGLVIMLLGIVRLTHPPAGATVLVVLMTHPGWSFLVTPVLAGAVTLVVVALGVHRLPPRAIYPLPVPIADGDLE